MPGPNTNLRGDCAESLPVIVCRSPLGSLRRFGGRGGPEERFGVRLLARTTRSRVPKRNPEVMNPDPLPGHVWLDTPGKVLHADERYLEFTGDPPEGS